MKTELLRASSVRGLSLVELMIAVGISVIALAGARRLLSGLFASQSADENRMSARMVADAAIRDIRKIYSEGDGTVTANTDPAGMTFSVGQGLSAIVMRTVCYAPPVGTEVVEAPYAAGRANVPDCPNKCPAGEIPRIEIIRGVNRTYYPSQVVGGIGGAMLCVKEFPPIRNVVNYSLSVYVSWKTRRVGTGNPALWEVDSAYLAPTGIVGSTKATLVP